MNCKCKTGWKSTEFWITACMVVASVILSFQELLTTEQAATGAAIAAGLYSISRGLAKTNKGMY